MNKVTKIVLAILIIALIISAGIIAIQAFKKKEKTESKTNFTSITSDEKLVEIIQKVYDNIDEELLPSVETAPVEIEDDSMVNTLTGLQNGNDLEYLIISHPLMSSQAYSFVLGKVKEGVDANKIAKEMAENVDTRRWVCVEAEQVYATSSGDIVCLIMGSKDTAKAVYDNFEKEAGSVGEKYEREAEEIELPPTEIYF